MAQAKSYGAQLGAADSLLEPKLEPGTKFSHPLMTAVCPRVLDFFHLKDSVSLHSRGTGQTPADKIHFSSPQYESVHGLLGRQSISLTRQQTRRN